MKNKRIILLLTTSVIALLVYIFVSCKKEFTCITVADREECKKSAKSALLVQKSIVITMSIMNVVVFNENQVAVERTASSRELYEKNV